MYSGLSYEERLAAYWTLIQRAWLASGHSMPAALPRGDLPGEVFRLTCNRAAGRAKDLADVEALESESDP